MSPLVLLFDIDGTLVDTGGAGRRAMERAFSQLTGRHDACAGIAFAGMTDRAIVRAGLTAVGHPCDHAAIDALLEAYLGYLEEEMLRTPAYIVHPGVREALQQAALLAGCALGLGTGNLRAGARLKLGKGGIYDVFRFGGFGCDHEERGEILRAGAERGAALLGAPRADCRVVVIGDTPRDVAAAHAIDAECLAVATGRHDVAELEACGATYVVRDLTERRAAQVLFGA